MVAIKHIIPFLAALSAALPHAPATHDDTALQARHEITTPHTAPVVLEKRVPSRSRIYWSPQGRLLFTVGLVSDPLSYLFKEKADSQQLTLDQQRISNEVHFSSIFWSSSVNIAKQLTFDFIDWIHEQRHPAADLYFPFELIGGVFGKGGEPDFFGIGMQLKQQFATNDNIQTFVDAFTQWGQQHGGLVQVVQRANDFFEPTRIGAGGHLKRSKTDYCPAEVEDALQYADDSDPYSEEIRWAEPCTVW
ncbi:MAG: hypothetical protein Q9207_001968 [Kuettlingeria erythrocarpa]